MDEESVRRARVEEGSENYRSHLTMRGVVRSLLSTEGTRTPVGCKHSALGENLREKCPNKMGTQTARVSCFSVAKRCRRPSVLTG